MALFFRLTLAIMLAVTALIAAIFIFKLLILAALVAALIVGGLFALNFIRALVARRGCRGAIR